MKDALKKGARRGHSSTLDLPVLGGGDMAQALEPSLKIGPRRCAHQFRYRVDGERAAFEQGLGLFQPVKRKQLLKGLPSVLFYVFG